MNELHFIGMSNDISENTVGTKAECGAWFAKQTDTEIKIEADEDGDMRMMVKTDGAEEWDLWDSVETLEEAYEIYFDDYVDDDSAIKGKLEDCIAYFVDYDSILVRITAWQVRNEDLDLDNETSVRRWFHDSEPSSEELAEMVKEMPCSKVKRALLETLAA
jgi:hypothetical protein